MPRVTFRAYTAKVRPRKGANEAGKGRSHGTEMVIGCGSVGWRTDSSQNGCVRRTNGRCLGHFLLLFAVGMLLGAGRVAALGRERDG